MMAEVQFAEWIGENHFALVDIINGIHYWRSESFEDKGMLTTEQVFDLYFQS